MTAESPNWLRFTRLGHSAADLVLSNLHRPAATGARPRRNWLCFARAALSRIPPLFLPCQAVRLNRHRRELGSFRTNSPYRHGPPGSPRPDVPRNWLCLARLAHAASRAPLYAGGLPDWLCFYTSRPEADSAGTLTRKAVSSLGRRELGLFGANSHHSDKQPHGRANSLPSDTFFPLRASVSSGSRSSLLTTEITEDTEKREARGGVICGSKTVARVPRLCRSASTPPGSLFTFQL